MKIFKSKMLIIIIGLIFFSMINDLSAQWESVNNGIENVQISRLFAYKDSMIFGIHTYKGVYVSKDYGESWQNFHNKIGSDSVLTFATYKNELVASVRHRGLLFSSDNGETWYRKSKRFANDTFVVKLGIKDNMILAGASVAGARYSAIYFSSNGGTTWEKIGDKFIYTDIYGMKQNMRKIGAVGFYKDFIYIAGYKGYYYTSDLGKTWYKSKGHEYDFWDIIHIDTTLYAATFGYAIINSSNSGISWDTCNSFYQDKKIFYVNDILSVDNYIFSTTQGLGLLMSKDLCKSWYSLRANLSTYLTHLTTLTLANDYIIISTFSTKYPNYDSNGVYRAKLSDLLLVSDVKRKIYNSSSLTIFPNPAGDYIDISTSAVILNEVKNPVIKIYDVLGVCVLTHPPTPSQEGEKVRLDVSGLAAGVYFVQVGKKVLKFVKM